MALCEIHLNNMCEHTTLKYTQCHIKITIYDNSYMVIKTISDYIASIILFKVAEGRIAFSALASSGWK
jgi:hypothetical protein